MMIRNLYERRYPWETVWRLIHVSSGGVDMTITCMIPIASD